MQASETTTNGESKRLILVTGDPICDHDYYRGNRATADSSEERGFRTIRTGGGALLLERLIQKTTEGLDGWTTTFGLQLNHESLPTHYHAFCFWEPQISDPNEKKEEKRFDVWRAVEPTLGYGQRENADSGSVLGTRQTLAGQPEIVVIDDAGLDFRRPSDPSRWPFPQKQEKSLSPSWIVLKLSGSIGEGELWKAIVSHCQNNLIVIVSADQLRRSDVRLSRGMSWESTVEDLLAELQGNPELQSLQQARHLIVTFRSDGAFWMHRDPGGPPSSMLVFDAANAEGDWEANQGKGGVFGYHSCFTAAIVHELCRSTKDQVPDFETALGAALGACRELRRLGNGRVKVLNEEKKLVDNPQPGFPLGEVAARIREPTETFVSTQLPAASERRGKWMMLDEWQVHARTKARLRPHYEAATAVVVLGPNALERFPVARFGNLQTVDRQEIESLRSLREIITAYQNGGPQKKPLSVGVFGPPGAGKSFGVTEIAKSVFGDKPEILTFNLSQFNDPHDLNGAFHQIRDKVLTGVTPIAFWDEFDSQGYRWLQYLLAPMQDGAFQEGQINHPIGKCIFVFAGATSQTFDAFGPRNPDAMEESEYKSLSDEQRRSVNETWRDFVQKKGPDFKSRLVSYLDVLGPNPRQSYVPLQGGRSWHDDPTDLCFPIRRAFFIRSQFKLKGSQRLDLDAGVLRALLQVPRFSSGARSLEFLCQHLLQSKTSTRRRSNLPGDHLLSMHVNAADFWRICEQDLMFKDIAPKLAHHLHEAYRLRIKGIERKKHLDVPLSELDPDMQAANIAQALRIPDALRLVSMHLVRDKAIALNELIDSRKDEDKNIRGVLAEKDNLELLSEAEHNGWMVERMLSGWRYGRDRDDKKKLHNLLIPYSQLSESDKEYDRQTIVGKPATKGDLSDEQFGYVDIVKTVGFRVAVGKPDV